MKFDSNNVGHWVLVALVVLVLYKVMLKENKLEKMGSCTNDLINCNDRWKPNQHKYNPDRSPCSAKVGRSLYENGPKRSHYFNYTPEGHYTNSYPRSHYLDRCSKNHYIDAYSAAARLDPRYCSRRMDGTCSNMNGASHECCSNLGKKYTKNADGKFCCTK
jgi:hypothetical protein